MDFSAWLSKFGYDETALGRPENAMQREHLTAAWQAEIGGGVQDRETAILAAVAKYSRGDPGKAVELESLGRQAIAEGWTPQRASLALLRLSRQLPPMVMAPRATGGQAADVLCASLCGTLGVSEADVGKIFGEATTNMAVARENRGATFHSIMRAVLGAAGKPVPAGKFTDQNIRDAFDASRDDMRAEGPSSFNLPGILSNVANKSALAAYSAVPTAWKYFCRVRELADFKPATSYRLTGRGTFEQVAPGGEIKDGGLTETAYTIQADTFGRLISIDRRDLINDDLGMFQQVPRVLGRMGAIALEKAVFTLLLANAGSPAFFSADHKNLSTGGGSALSLAGLAASYKLFMQQLDDNSDPTLIIPTVLLVPSALEITARQLVRSTTVVGTASPVVPSGNEFANMFEPVTSPFLAASTGLSGASDAGWYLLTGPGDYAAVQVGFLYGTEMPTVEHAVMDFDRLGLSMRAYHDWGVGFHDFRGGVLSVGS